MTTQSYIHEWEFRDGGAWELSDASLLTAADGVARLRPVQPAAFLPGRTGRSYSTADDLYVRTAPFAPGIVTGWGFIEGIGDEPESYDGAAETSLSYRLHDGTDSRFWNGAAWAVAGAGDWNTLADFNANLSSYTGASLAVEARLRTTDGDLTPLLRVVKLKWTGEVVNTLREWLYNGVVRSLVNAVRPTTDYVIELAATGASFALSSYPLEAGWDITDVVAAYNETDDPGHTTDILDNYAAGTVTLTGSLAAGKQVWLVMRYAPQVAVTTDHDFSEAAKAPAIYITSVRVPTDTRRGLGASGPHIIDRSAATPAGTAFPLPVPLVDIELTFALVAPGSVDLLKLQGVFADWMHAHPTLACSTFDASVRLEPGPAMDWSTEIANLGDPRQSASSLRLRNVPWYGDADSASADGSASARLGPVDAGDAGAPGVGYGVKRARFRWSSKTGPGADTQDMT